MSKGSNVVKPIPDTRRSPLIWPWRGSDRQKLSIRGVLTSRKFSFSYLLISWMLVAFFGFASNRDCDSSWQLRFLCEHAIWLVKIRTEPLVFFWSLFPSAWLHNGVEHLLFVSIIGILIIVQSFESQYGTRVTVFIFFITHILIGITFATIFNLGIGLWPQVDFLRYGFERNWMGGSVGFFGITGAFSFFHKRGWALSIIALSFELVNHFILGTSLHISMIHTLCLVYGYWIGCFYVKVTKI